MQSTIKQTLWGTSERLHLSDRLQIELIRGGKGGASSLHRHLRKDNEFRLIAGAMRIHIEHAADPSVVDLSIASPTIAVPAGVLHRMEFLEDSIAVETYFPVTGQVLDPDDIERPNGQDGRAPAAAEHPAVPASIPGSDVDPFDPRRRIRKFLVDLKWFHGGPHSVNIPSGLQVLFPGCLVATWGENQRKRVRVYVVQHPSFDLVDVAWPPEYRLIPGNGQKPTTIEAIL